MTAMNPTGDTGKESVGNDDDNLLNQPDLFIHCIALVMRLHGHRWKYLLKQQLLNDGVDFSSTLIFISDHVGYRLVHK